MLNFEKEIQENQKGEQGKQEKHERSKRPAIKVKLSSRGGDSRVGGLDEARDVLDLTTNIFKAKLAARRGASVTRSSIATLRVRNEMQYCGDIHDASLHFLHLCVLLL